MCAGHVQVEKLRLYRTGKAIYFPNSTPEQKASAHPGQVDIGQLYTRPMLIKPLCLKLTHMTNTSNPKTALITGASRGLGLALARELAQQGWQLIIDARGSAALNQAAAELSPYTTVCAIPGDVGDPQHLQALAAAAEQLGGVDVVVNNAGILGPSPQPELLDYPLDTLADVYRLNVLAPLALLQTIRPQLKPNAAIINVTSDAGVEAYPGWGGYGSSKAALEQLSAILAAENPNYRVYWVDPGDMRTQMQQNAFPGEDISDRPLPEASVPGFVALLEGDYPSGRYRSNDLVNGNR